MKPGEALESDMSLSESEVAATALPSPLSKSKPRQIGGVRGFEIRVYRARKMTT